MIRYYEGVEGSGKTCMMTRDIYRHRLYGGRVLSLPGYELYGRTKKSVLSEVIFPEQILEMISVDDTEPIRKQRIAIVMDEVTNWFNNHDWQSKINDIVSILCQERRKFGVAVLMTGPEEYHLPPRIREFIHEIVHCLNVHSLNRDIPNDMMCLYWKEDRRGMLSHPRFHFTRKHRFYMKPWQKHYNTYTPVGYNLNRRYRIMKQDVVLGPDGIPIGGDNEGYYIDKKITIAAKVEELRQQGKTGLKAFEYAILLDELNLTNSKMVKNMFAAHGLYWEPGSQEYVLHSSHSMVGVD